MSYSNEITEQTIEELELQSWRRKLIGSWIFAIPIALLMFSERFFGMSVIPKSWVVPILLILGFPVIFIFGLSTIKIGLKGFYNFYFNMDSLIALGTVIAYFTGFFSYFNFVDDYSGVASMIMAIFITGKFIETKAKGKASQEIRKLLELGAKKARILRNNKEIEININEVKIGDIMIVKPGEKIPTDGIVVKGYSAGDEAETKFFRCTKCKYTWREYR